MCILFYKVRNVDTGKIFYCKDSFLNIPEIKNQVWYKNDFSYKGNKYLMLNCYSNYNYTIKNKIIKKIVFYIFKIVNGLLREIKQTFGSWEFNS